MDICEMCGRRGGRWYVIDDNAEVVLHPRCAKALKASGEVGSVEVVHGG